MVLKLKEGLRKPEDVWDAVAICLTAKTQRRYLDAIWALYKYKWYNWYQLMHVKEDSPEDIENTYIFDMLKESYPIIHEDIEDHIRTEVARLNRPIEDDF